MSTFEVMSGIQPSGELHLGNYFGAVANWVRLQEKHRCIFGVVDYHAMTAPFEPKTLKRWTHHMVAGLLACGIDPDRSGFFLQSLVPEHTELAWIFNCLTPYAWVAKMTQFKDKSRQVEEQGLSFSTGLLTYPLLQAADILLYKATRIPVGQDQDQHLELARDVARVFNRTFGDLFPEPEAIYTETPKILSVADPEKKMSGSLGPKHYIALFEEPDSIRKKVKSAVTDTGEATERPGAGAQGLLTLLRAAGHGEEAAAFEKEFASGPRRYAPLKEAVAEALVAFTAPLRERYEALAADPEALMQRVRRSSAQVREVARTTLKEARQAIGLPVLG